MKSGLFMRPPLRRGYKTTTLVKSVRADRSEMEPLEIHDQQPGPATETQPAAAEQTPDVKISPQAPAEAKAEGAEIDEGKDAKLEAATAAEPQHAKPLLTVEEQIAHLKAKGVTFELCIEDEAAEYLSDKTYYFKIAAYRTLFQKRIGGEGDGQYVGLDFGNLVELASVDRTLRYTMLPMTLNVEHYSRVRLIRRLEAEQGEDGYSVVTDYMASLNHDNRRRRLAEINMLEPDTYCGDLVRKYRDDMPVWTFLELVSFGSFIDFYLFCASRWNDAEMEDEHYMLRQVKAARNASAHSSNVVNGFGAKDGAIATNDSVAAAIMEAGVSKRVRTAKMRNPRLQQIATLLYVHRRLVPEGTSKSRTRDDLKALAAEMKAVVANLPSNDPVRSSFDFPTTLFAEWF